MLTGIVNIAVFATFAFCSGDDLLSNPEFKPVCWIEPLDIAHYGRQTWQRSGKKRQGYGKAGGKNGNVWVVAGRSYPCRGWCKRARWAWLARYAVVQVQAAHGGVATIERKYHKVCGMSSGRNVRCRTPGYFPLRCGDQHPTGCGSIAICVEMLWLRAGGADMPACWRTKMPVPLTISHPDQIGITRRGAFPRIAGARVAARGASRRPPCHPARPA